MLKKFYQILTNLEIKFIFLYLLHKKIGCFEVKDPMFWDKRSDVFVLPLLFYNDNIKEYQRYIKQFRRLWLCRNYGLTELRNHGGFTLLCQDNKTTSMAEAGL